MKRFGILAVALAGMLLGALPQATAATLEAQVNVANQTMTVTKHGRVLHVWKVSTARRGYITPSGSWRPKRMHRMWYSRKYDMSPMPYAVFYNGGYAIHGTSAVKRLGTPASHGCVRLLTANAATFYSLVQQVGPGNTRIVVTN